MHNTQFDVDDAKGAFLGCFLLLLSWLIAAALSIGMVLLVIWITVNWIL